MKNKLLRISLLILLMGMSYILEAQSLLSLDGAKGYIYDSLSFDNMIYIPTQKAKKIPAGKKLQFVSFVKLKDGFYYDAYQVSYKGKDYVIHHSFVADSDMLNRKNKSLDSIKVKLYNNMDSTRAVYLNAAKDYQVQKEKRILLYKTQIDSLEKLIPSLENMANAYADSMARDEELKLEAQYKVEQDSVEKLLPQRVRLLTKKIHITENKLKTPNSVGGCDYEFSYKNVSGKTIKYLRWYGHVYNAVDDPVYCDISNTDYVSGKDTGPYEDGDNYCGGVWSCIIYNYSAHKVYLDYISIDYMDGTSSSFSLKKYDLDKLQGYYKGMEFIEGKFFNNLMDIDRGKYLNKKSLELGIPWIITQKGLLKAKLKEEEYSESDDILRECSENALNAKKRYEYFIATGETLEMKESESGSITDSNFQYAEEGSSEDCDFSILQEAVIADLSSIPDGLVYHIQLLTTDRKASPSQLKGISPVFERTIHSGRYTYLAGVFYSYAKALNCLQDVKKMGFPMAIITAYDNGRAITIKRAKELEDLENHVKNITIEEFFR